MRGWLFRLWWTATRWPMWCWWTVRRWCGQDCYRLPRHNVFGLIGYGLKKRSLRAPASVPFAGRVLLDGEDVTDRLYACSVYSGTAVLYHRSATGSPHLEHMPCGHLWLCDHSCPACLASEREDVMWGRGAALEFRRGRVELIEAP